MSFKEVATIGSWFRGECSKKGHGSFTGQFSKKGSVVISLGGNPVCVTGTTGQASCGCTVRAIGGSKIFKLNGLSVARVGDEIEEDGGGGSITGEITSGVDWLIIE